MTQARRRRRHRALTGVTAAVPAWRALHVLDTFAQRHISAAALAERYFAARGDDPRPPSSS
jgi:hypothetical protein